MDHLNNTAEPAEIERARSMWGNFTETSKYAVIGIIGLLVLMALFLL